MLIAPTALRQDRRKGDPEPVGIFPDLNTRRFGDFPVELQGFAPVRPGCQVPQLDRVHFRSTDQLIKLIPRIIPFDCFQRSGDPIM